MNRPTLLLAVLLGIAISLPAGAQSYPAGPVRLVVPFPAGGLSEVLAREVAKKMAETLGQPMVIENIGGAGSTIGMAAVARAAPNGHTLLFGYSSGLTIGPALYRNLPYDASTAFVPIGGVARFAFLLAAPASAPFNTLGELIAWAKANPGKLSLGTPGVGSTPHLIGEILNTKAGISILHVPYKGVPQLIPDLMAGRIDLAWDAISNLRSGVQARKIKPLAITAVGRSPEFPGVETVAESGIPELGIYTWTAILAPAKTPREITAKLEDALARALATADVQQTYTGRGLEVFPASPQQLVDAMRVETARWADIVQRAGVKAE